jgi:hypothetical protein
MLHTLDGAHNYLYMIRGNNPIDRALSSNAVQLDLLTSHSEGYRPILTQSLDEKIYDAQSLVENTQSTLDTLQQATTIKTIELQSMQRRYGLALRDIYKTQYKANLAKDLESEIKIQYDTTATKISTALYQTLGNTIESIAKVIGYTLCGGVSGAIAGETISLFSIYNEIGAGLGQGFIVGAALIGGITLLGTIPRIAEPILKYKASREELFRPYKSSELKRQESLNKIGESFSLEERKSLEREAKEEFNSAEKRIQNESRDERCQRLGQIGDGLIAEVEKFYDSHIGNTLETSQNEIANEQKAIIDTEQLLTAAKLDLNNRVRQGETASVNETMSQMTEQFVGIVIQLAEEVQQDLSINAHSPSNLYENLQGFNELDRGLMTQLTNEEEDLLSGKNDFDEISDCIDKLKQYPSSQAASSALKIILAQKKLESTHDVAAELVLQSDSNNNLSEIANKHYKNFVQNLCRSLFAPEDELNLSGNEFLSVSDADRETLTVKA